MRLPSLPRPTVGANTLLLLVAAFLVATANLRFWSITLEATTGGSTSRLLVLGAVALALFALTLLVLLPLSNRWTLKPWLVVVLVLSASAAYFIDGFGAVIDRHALASVYETDAREAGEWVAPRMLLVIAVLGVLPALAVAWVRVEWRRPLRELGARLQLVVLAFVLLAVAALSAGKDVASLVRNRMELRHVANPFALVAAHLSYLDHLRDAGRPFERIALDARRGGALAPGRVPVVLVVVVGESARAASLDLNGYTRDTDVELHGVPVVNFPNVSSCGTNTATSVPCMFSGLGRAHYEDGAAKHRENLLDVLHRAGWDVVWLDNNTGSKHLADRLVERNVARGADPELCNADGCHDEVLLDALRDTLPTVKRDTVIVLHMLGSHGPAYYARYPRAFAAFQPECMTPALHTCSDAQIRNTYDNTILYSSHVLAGIAGLLGDRSAMANHHAMRDVACLARAGSGMQGEVCGVGDATDRGLAEADAAAQRFDAAMLFISDHGESLGEKGLYLHGAPVAIAPKEQTRVPMLFWGSPGFTRRRGLDLACLRTQANRPLSHDNFFDTLLGLGDVATRDYQRQRDAFAACERATPGAGNTALARPRD